MRALCILHYVDPLRVASARVRELSRASSCYGFGPPTEKARSAHSSAITTD